MAVIDPNDLRGNPMWLNELMEFDHVIRVNPDLSISDDIADIYAPESTIDVDSDGQIMPDGEKLWEEYLERQGWKPLYGYSEGMGSDSPMMHSGQVIRGHLADEISDTPGYWVAVTVETLDNSGKAAGWAVLFREADNESEDYVCPCCADGVMDTRPVCEDCREAECKRTTAGDGIRGWYNCQRPDTDDDSED